MRAGLYARAPRWLETWHGPDRFYFTSQLGSSAISDELLARANAICEGRRVVLGLGEIPREHFAHPDPRMVWEINRGHDWVVLARVFAATRERRFFKQLEVELDSWRRMNPLGIGINWSGAMEAAIRIHSLAWVAGFLRGHRSLSAVRIAMFEHAAFVERRLSCFSSANNHLIVELSGLVVAARSLGTGGHRAALQRLETELGRQIFADGVDAEMATHYHAFVLEALLLVAYLERAYGEPSAAIEHVIGRMADYLAALRCDDGTLLQQGDSDDGTILPFFGPDHAVELLNAAAALRRPTSDRDPRTRVYWLSNGQSGVHERTTTSRVFVESGQVVFRSSRLAASFDAGPFGFGALAAHAHCDALAIAVAVDGRRFLVDRGTYSYRGPDRDRFRMTAAHNTIQLGSDEQGEPAGPFLWARQPTVRLEHWELTIAGDIARASHDGFGGARHQRTLVHRDGILLVIDRILHATALITSRYHLAPELKPLQSGSRFEIASGGWLQVIATAKVGVSIVETNHSDVYGALRSAQTIECRLMSSPNDYLVCMIGPSAIGEHRDAISKVTSFALARGLIPESMAQGLVS